MSVQLNNTPGSDHMAQPLHSHITANERNSRIVNKSFQEAVDACENNDDALETKTTEHCKLLDKQEKERQESLESMAERVKNDKRDKMNLRSEIDGLKSKLTKEKEEIDREETERLRKYVQQKKEQDKQPSETAVPKEEGRKRKRDAEKEDHVDIDMLL
jgi:intergrase/recombinase